MTKLIPHSKETKLTPQSKETKLIPNGLFPTTKILKQQTYGAKEGKKAKRDVLHSTKWEESKYSRVFERNQLSQVAHPPL